MFTILEGEIELTFRGAAQRAMTGSTVNVPANAPHSFKNTSDEPARLLCMCTPAGQDEFFMAVGDLVDSRTAPPPRLKSGRTGRTHPASKGPRGQISNGAVGMKDPDFGATGGTGREIVRQAGAQGHQAVALVRSKTKAADVSGAELVEGDARDEQALARALEGCSGVILQLARDGDKSLPRGDASVGGHPRAGKGDGGRQRPPLVTGLGAGDSRGHGGFLFDTLIFPLLLRKVYDDKDRQEDAVRASKLDWVLVRPVVLNDKPARGAVRALTDLSAIHGGTVGPQRCREIRGPAVD